MTMDRSLTLVARTRNGIVGNVVIRPTPTGKRWAVTVYVDRGSATRFCRSERTARRTALAVRDHLVRSWP